jgi:hypothetical protein
MNITRQILMEGVIRMGFNLVGIVVAILIVILVKNWNNGDLIPFLFRAAYFFLELIVAAAFIHWVLK